MPCRALTDATRTVKLRNFEDLLDTWREKYNIDYDLSELEASAEPEGDYCEQRERAVHSRPLL